MSLDKTEVPDSSGSGSGSETETEYRRPDDPADRHLPYLLAGALQRLRNELTPSIPADLRVSHLRVLEELDRGAADRPTGFAPILGMTKAGAGKVCDQLEAAGLVESVDDPQDARVRRLRITDRGRTVVGGSSRAIDDLERRWADEVGDSAYEALRRTLARLIRGTTAERP